VATGRLSDQEDAFRVHVQLLRIGVNVADRALKVLVTRGSGRATDQSIVDGHRKKTKSCPLLYLDRGSVAPISSAPTASMYGNDCRQRFVRSGISDVRQQAGSMDATIDYVFFETHFWSIIECRLIVAMRQRLMKGEK
jgi:hypothetical protein